jgi:hypothetical protein
MNAEDNWIRTHLECIFFIMLSATICEICGQILLNFERTNLLFFVFFVPPW